MVTSDKHALIPTNVLPNVISSTIVTSVKHAFTVRKLVEIISTAFRSSEIVTSVKHAFSDLNVLLTDMSLLDIILYATISFASKLSTTVTSVKHAFVTFIRLPAALVKDTESTCA
ncbi:hypothetical protein [Heterosigma akashiwo virus 01]|uniref:Uncharacterized protein n=1 Tax=Heterosigma akashiwo virus 01 TaxID=97195 RepID=A0A1C9C5I6_HAV01|nr:hypothetical protein D1R72_gp214 [Heterosigma akashiwo virus 01]AOM63545.1 hypothetical protein [Heterosigma akashiwo virus 01]